MHEKLKGQHKILLQDFKRCAISYLHSTNLEYKLQQQLLISIYIYTKCLQTARFFPFLCPLTLIFINT